MVSFLEIYGNGGGEKTLQGKNAEVLLFFSYITVSWEIQSSRNISIAVALNGDSFVSQRTFVYFWRHLWWSQLAGVVMGSVLLASNGQKPGMLRTSNNIQDRLAQQRTIWSQMSIELRLRNPHLYLWKNYWQVLLLGLWSGSAPYWLAGRTLHPTCSVSHMLPGPVISPQEGQTVLVASSRRSPSTSSHFKTFPLIIQFRISQVSVSIAGKSRPFFFGKVVVYIYYGHLS